jgi:osmotically-inducible protein OsmY
MRTLKYFVPIGGVIALVAVTAFNGCSWSSEKEARASGRTVTQVTDDKRISERVAYSLRESPVYKFPEVGVRTFDRAVQLNGFVATEEQKRAAGEIAQQAPGAQRVINDIVVQPQVLEPTGRTNQPVPPPRNQSGS